MGKIDWKRKLTSRKLWVAVAGFVSGIIILVVKNEGLAESISGLILAGGSVIAYIIGEGLADSSYNAANQKVVYVNTNVDLNSDVDGNELLSACGLDSCEIAGIDLISDKKSNYTYANAVPDTTGRDGVTIDGNEVEV